MNSTTKHAWTKPLGTMLAAVAFLAALAPSNATALKPGPARCGANGTFAGGIKVSGCAIDDCVRKGGLIEIDEGRPYCCVASGYGADRVVVCDEVDQLIDMIVTPLPPTRVWTPRPFGEVSRFAK